MIWKAITKEKHTLYNHIVSDPHQTYEWGEFRTIMGAKVVRKGFFEGNILVAGFSLSIHKISRTTWCIGFLQGCDFPNHDLIEEIKRIGKKEHCIFIQIESYQLQKDAPLDFRAQLKNLGLIPSVQPMCSDDLFILDLTQSEHDILKNMNLHKNAQNYINKCYQHNIKLVEDNSRQALEKFWIFKDDVAHRKNFFPQTRRYYECLWENFYQTDREKSSIKYYQFLVTHQDQVLSISISFAFKDTFYCMHKASSSEHLNGLSYGVFEIWEIIRFAKNMGFKFLNIGGGAGMNPPANSQKLGFHEFKKSLGFEHVPLVGSYNLVINPMLYQSYKIANTLRWKLLDFKRRFISHCLKL